MPPMPIVFHTHPSSSRIPAGINTSHQPVYYSLAPPRSSSSTQPIIIKPSPVIPIATSSSSSTSTDPTPSSASRTRRKTTTAHRAPTRGYITLTPLNSSILDRCLLQSRTNTSTPAISPRKAKSHPVAIPNIIHPYSRLIDLGNDRSPNPSPREILRYQRQEEERIRNKKDTVAAARAAVAAKRKPKKGGAKKGVTQAALVRSPSPSNEVRGLLGLGGSGLSKEILPTITTELATPASTPLPTPASRTLKRTRSTGMTPLATNLANSLGNGNLAVGSPLKAVTGPIDDTLLDGEEVGDRRAKRSRTQEPTIPIPHGTTTRKKSHSPNTGNTSTLPDAPTVPKTHPLASSRLVPTAQSTRQGNRASSVALGGGLDPASAGAGGTGMRRVVSAAGTGTAAARRESTGSQGSEGMVSQRSRREVNLPRALRDYETRPGTMA